MNTDENHITCHTFVGMNNAKPGQIEYRYDCDHLLANTVINLPKWDENNVSKLIDWTENVLWKMSNEELRKWVAKNGSQ